MQLHKIYICVASLGSLLSLFMCTQTMASPQIKETLYQLVLSFEIPQHQVVGTAHITIAAGKKLTLFLNDITVTGMVLQREMATPQTINSQDLSKITIPAAKVQQELFISYRKKIAPNTENYLETDGITLLENFYPQPAEDVLFQVSANLPPGFKAICESDSLENAQNIPASFFFSKPSKVFHFIAGPFSIDTLDVREGLTVSTFFFQEDKQLAEKYLLAAVKYIRYYDNQIGPYPFNHFAIVENRLPSGYGMQTFTLLGQSVIRLPFILDTSLGHEILHSWFGNGVQVKDESGNWCEGLTTYLADWSYREKKQQDAANRKEQITKYLSYVNQTNAISLNSFHSASHNQQLAKTVRSVGYIKGAMLFHELKIRVGKEAFDKAISLFYTRFNGKQAGWNDIESVFSEISQMNLERFFNEHLNRVDIPKLEVKGIEVNSTAAGIKLSFSLLQKTDTPYDLVVPLQVVTATGVQNYSTRITAEKETIELLLESTPEELLIDPQYDLLRQFDISEKVPSLSHFLDHAANTTVILSEQDRALYSPFLSAFGQSGWTIRTIDNVTNKELSEGNIVFLGTDNLHYKSLFALPDYPETGCTVSAKLHPLKNDGYILIVQGSSEQELASATAKLSHYGKYSFLHFINGKIMEKKIEETSVGQRYKLESRPVGIPSKSFMTFNNIVEDIRDSRAIYVGESHTSMTDHHLQYLILESLFNMNHNIAIGMEMFPSSSQEILDRYVLGNEDMNEKEFLKKSHYFQVWSYDYRYYRAIINFAKKNHIPLIGLNIDKSIVSTVFKEGSTDSLSSEQKALLPEDINLAMPGYSDRLHKMHNIHMTGGHGQGNIAGFIQAQAIWDEVMAKNISDYLRKNPEKQIIVLAGAQHTRNDSGIPPRVKRRADIAQHTLLSATSLNGEIAPLADYYIASSEKSLAQAGKIGVTLEEDKDEHPHLRITAISPHSNAAEAGIHIHDILRSINGYQVETLEDVRIAMVDAKPKDSFSLVIERKDDGHQPQSVTLAVDLYTPLQDI